MMIRDNAGKSSPSVVGRDVKLGAGLLFAESVENASLASALAACGATNMTEGTPEHALARAIAPSPTLVDADVVAAWRSLSPAAVVELTTFVSLAQLLHRLESYFSHE